MTMLLPENEIVSPSASEIEVAKESSRTLAPHIGEGSWRIQVTDDTGHDEVVLPPSAARLLLDMLTEMGRGNSVLFAPVQAELTLPSAAEFLHLSPSFVLKLLDDKALPFQTRGAERRIRLADLLAYKKELRAKRYAALEQLSAIDQELGLY